MNADAAKEIYQLGRDEHRVTQSNTLSQSEHDWAFGKRALARGDDPEVVIQRIADYRSDDKGDPNYCARRTVTKALVELGNRESDPAHAHRSAVQHSREPEHQHRKLNFTT